MHRSIMQLQIWKIVHSVSPHSSACSAAVAAAAVSISDMGMQSSQYALGLKMQQFTAQNEHFHHLKKCEVLAMGTQSSVPHALSCSCAAPSSALHPLHREHIAALWVLNSFTISSDKKNSASFQQSSQNPVANAVLFIDSSIIQAS